MEKDRWNGSYVNDPRLKVVIVTYTYYDIEEALLYSDEYDRFYREEGVHSEHTLSIAYSPTGKICYTLCFYIKK